MDVFLRNPLFRCWFVRQAYRLKIACAIILSAPLQRKRWGMRGSVHDYTSRLGVGGWCEGESTTLPLEPDILS